MPAGLSRRPHPGEAMSEPQIITFSIPSRLELLPVLDRLVQGINAEMGFEEDDADAISISIIEAGTNAIQHGHKRDASKIVDFRFDLHADRLIVTVHDSGPGFDVNAVTEADPTMPDGLLRCSGRGIFIMRQMMDQIDFDFSRGTSVRLQKQKRTNGRG